MDEGQAPAAIRKDEFTRAVATIPGLGPGALVGALHGGQGGGVGGFGLGGGHRHEASPSGSQDQGNFIASSDGVTQGECACIWKTNGAAGI